MNCEASIVKSALKAKNTCLCNHLRTADRVVRQIYDEALRPLGLKPTQFTLLNAILLREPVKQNVLAECTLTDRTTLTRNLSSLERQELVQIQQGSDRRVKEISLTLKGKQLLTEAYPYWEKAQTKIEELIGKGELFQLLAELNEVTGKLSGK